MTVIGLVVLAAAIGVLAGMGNSPTWSAVLALALLHVFAENQVTDTTPEIGSSAGVMLSVAAMVVFRDDQSALGVFLVGLAGGLYLPTIRNREWNKLAFNCAMFPLSAMAAVYVFWGLAGTGSASPAKLLAAALPAALVYSVVNVVLVCFVVTLATGQRFREVLAAGSREYFVYYPFAVMGVFLGLLYLEYQLALLPLFLVPILVARQAFSSYLAQKRSHEATVRILVGALEAKDPYTAGHAERVAEYAQYIGLELGISPGRLERLRLAALMHDVGKLVVPNHLLNKPGKLTSEEFAVVRQHEDVSVEILTRIDFLAPVAAERDERSRPLLPGGRRPRPTHRTAHRCSGRRLRRDDVHAFLPASVDPGHRVRRVAQELGTPVSSTRRRRADRRAAATWRSARRRPRVLCPSRGRSDLLGWLGRSRRSAAGRQGVRVARYSGNHDPMNLVGRGGVLLGVGGLVALVTEVGSPGGDMTALVVLATVVALGELVALRPPHRQPIPLSYAYMLVIVRSFAFLPAAVAILAAEAAAAIVQPASSRRERFEAAATHGVAGLVGLTVFAAVHRGNVLDATPWLLTVLALSAMAMLLVHEAASFLRVRRVPPVGGADLALIASGMLMAIGFRAVGGHESVGLWAVALFSVPLFAAWYSFERLAVISRTSEQTIEALSVVPEMAGLAVEGHAERVAELSERIGDELGLRRRDLDALRQAALLHHLGHLCLDAPEVRDRPVEPFEIADKGAEILRQTDLAAAGDLLATDQVTAGSQVLRIASAFDDLRRTATTDEALDALASGPGFLYDRAVFDALERVVAVPARA